MPQRHGALRGVGSQVGLKPGELRGTWTAAADAGANTVERDDVPRAEVVAVVTTASGTSRCTEVTEVTRRIGGAVLMVADRRVCARLEGPPAWLIAVGVIHRASRSRRRSRRGPARRRLSKPPARRSVRRPGSCSRRRRPPPRPERLVPTQSGRDTRCNRRGRARYWRISHRLTLLLPDAAVKPVEPSGLDLQGRPGAATAAGATPVRSPARASTSAKADPQVARRPGTPERERDDRRYPSF